MGLTEQSFGPVLEAAKIGAEWAWATIYRELAGSVTGYLAGRGAAEPEDMTSEVFLQVARRAHGFSGGLGEFRSWVFVIAHSKLIDDRRMTTRRGRLAELGDDAVGVVGDVEEEALESLMTSELRRIFETLGASHRDVLALRIIGGLSLEETAAVLGKKVGAIKAAQHRAVEALRAKLDAEEVTL